MDVLQPALKAAGGAQAISKGKVILGTVKGDMHDIGKNLVRTMLDGAQFEVIDLGVDVSPEKFVEAVRVHQPQIVAMSALLTTTLKGMKMTVDALREAGLDGQVKVMIGGAPVSREYADQIGAQGYARFGGQRSVRGRKAAKGLAHEHKNLSHNLQGPAGGHNRDRTDAGSVPAGHWREACLADL